MRSAAIENLLLRFMEEVNSARKTGRVDLQVLFNLSAKGYILLNREDNRAGSVIRELTNEQK